MNTVWKRGVVVAALALVFADTAAAQIQASPRGMVGQTIDGTTITLEYGRPSVRGRDIYGGAVPFDVVWTPGANWATTFETDKDIKLNGVSVPAGDYSVWVIPRADEWTVMLNPEPKIFHFMKPDSTQATVHLTARAKPAEHTEMLTWSFEQVRGDFAQLALNWAGTEVAMQVEVPATRPVITEDEMAMVVGTYEMTIAMPDPTWPTEATLDVYEEDGKLRGRMSFTIHPVDDNVFDLVPAGGNRYNPGLYHDGVFFNVEMGVGFDFKMDGERAIGFEFRAGNGLLLGEGKRATDR